MRNLFHFGILYSIRSPTGPAVESNKKTGQHYFYFHKQFEITQSPVKSKLFTSDQTPRDCKSDLVVEAYDAYMMHLEVRQIFFILIRIVKMGEEDNVRPLLYAGH